MEKALSMSSISTKPNNKSDFGNNSKSLRENKSQQSLTGFVSKQIDSVVSFFGSGNAAQNAPSPLHNFGGNCYVNSSLQLLEILDIPWETGLSDLSKLFHCFLTTHSQFAQKELLDYFSIEFQKNVIFPGDIKEILLLIMDLLKEKDSHLLQDLIHNKKVTSFCSRCTMFDTKYSRNNLFLFLSEVEHANSEIIDPPIKLPSRNFSCCETSNNQFILPSFFETPKFLLIFSDHVKKFDSEITVASSKEKKRIIYEIIGFSRNFGGHCSAMVKKGGQWWHCNDHSISKTSPETTNFSITEKHLVLVYKRIN